MNFKDSRRGLRRKHMNPNEYVHCCVIGCHGNSLLSPRFSKEKRGLCNTVRRPSVRPSVYLSIGLYLLLGY